MSGSWRVKAALLGVVVLIIVLALPALAAALPPEYPAAWSVSPDGLRQLGALTTDAGLCRGPSGYVFEVASQSSAGGVQALTSKVATGSGAVADSWTYPAKPDTQTFLPKAIARDAAGNLVVAMTSAGGWTIAKFSPSGSLLWDEDYAAGADRAPYAIAFDRKNAVVVVGQCSVAAGTGVDAAVVKWTSRGAFQWAKTLSGTSAVSDFLWGVGTDGNNNVYASGMAGGTRSTAVLRSFTPAGRKRWSVSVGQSTRDVRFVALVVKGTSVYAAGDCHGADGGFVAAKYTLRGKRVWGLKTRIFEQEGAEATGLAVDSTNAVVVAGEASELAPAGVDVPALWKLTPAGRTAWHREVTGTGWSNGTFAALALDGGDKIYAAGMSGAHQQASGTLVMRYSAKGAAQAMWTPDGGPAAVGEFLHLLVVGNQQVLVSGNMEQGQRQAVVYRAKTSR
jgi:hypothetical protein